MFLGLVWLQVSAQDVVFSQPLSTLLYTNPGYSGASESYRLGAAARSQFSSAGNPYNTFYADFDLYAASINSGFGLYVMNDRSDVWQTTSIGISYAYAFHVAENIVLRPALQAVYYRQDQGSRSYLFPDGITGGTTSPVTYPAMNEVKNGFDFASGLLAVHPLWEAGFSAGHVGASRNDSLAVYANRALKWIVHGRAAISLAGEAGLNAPALSEWNAFTNLQLIPHALLSYQVDYAVLVAGADLRAGALSAGLNVKSNLTFEAAVLGLSLGLSSERLKIGYNIDIMAFGAQLGMWNSLSHEFFIHFNWGETTEARTKSTKKINRKGDCIGCPY